MQRNDKLMEEANRSAHHFTNTNAFLSLGLSCHFTKILKSLEQKWFRAKISKMMKDFRTVSLQVFLLMIGGLWPIWKRPLKAFKVQNGILVGYTILVFACHSLAFACDINRHIQVAKSYFDVKLYLSALRYGCSYVTQLSVLHMALCKFPLFHRKLKSISSCSSLDKKWSFCLLLITISLKFYMGYILFLSLVLFVKQPSDLPSWYFSRGLTFSGSKLESVLYFAINYYLSAIHMEFIPLSLLLGYSMMIRQEFHHLKYQFCKAFYNKLENKDHVADLPRQSKHSGLLSFIEFGEKFDELCEVVDSLNETFFVYILVATVTIVIHVIYGIRTLGLSCHVNITVVRISIVNAVFAFFVLCLCGEVISSVVSSSVLVLVRQTKIRGDKIQHFLFCIQQRATNNVNTCGFQAQTVGSVVARMKKNNLAIDTKHQVK